jgi:hypothetical protein
LETSTLRPWQPRDASDGSRAILVNERQTVFDRPSPALQQRRDPLEAIADPVWQSHEGRFWTPDLVHCRLVIVGEIIARLPGRLRLQGYVSQLGNIALSEASPARRVPPSPHEITLADWTWQELMALDEGPRALLQARAFSSPSTRSPSTKAPRPRDQQDHGHSRLPRAAAALGGTLAARRREGRRARPRSLARVIRAAQNKRWTVWTDFE